MKRFKVWKGFCADCGKPVVGFEILQRVNASEKNKWRIQWQHEDGNFYRHMVMVEDKYLVAEGDL